MAAAVEHAPGGHGHLVELLRGLPAAPTVEAKEVEGIVLLKRRQGLARLDLGPFAVLYALITLQLVYRAATGQWCGGSCWT